MAQLRKRACYKLYQLNRIIHNVDRNDALSIYSHCVLPTFEYCSFVLDSASNLDQKSLQTLQNKGLRDCIGIRNPRDITREELHRTCKVDTLSRRRDISLLMLMFKLSKDPENLVENTRQRTRGDLKVKIKCPRTKLQLIKKSPLYRGLILWDSLDHDVQKLQTNVSFKRAINKIDFAIVKERHNAR